MATRYTHLKSVTFSVILSLIFFYSFIVFKLLGDFMVLFSLEKYTTYGGNYLINGIIHLVCSRLAKER